MVVFALQAGYLAFTRSYPMIFDEETHYGVAQVMSEYPLPYIPAQQLEYDTYGYIAKGNASLYYYLLSIPYRIIHIFTNNLAITVIALRFINIGLFIAGMYIFRRLFLAVGIRRDAINWAALVYTMVPVVPFVAATINYDNLMQLVAALHMLVTVKLLKSKQYSLAQTAAFIVTALIGILVKFSFFPIVAVSGFAIILDLVIKKKKIIFEKSTLLTPKTMILVVALVILAGLAGVSVGKNIVKYHTISTPNCERIMSKERCAKNPVNANRYAHENSLVRGNPNIKYYISEFVNGTSETEAYTAHVVNGQLMMGYSVKTINYIVYFIPFVAIVIILWSRQLYFRATAWYCMCIAIGITLAIFLFSHSAYLSTGSAYMIQGRYLIIPLIIVIAFAVDAVLRSRHPRLVVTMLIILVLLMTQGGGVVNHIVRSDETWAWNNSIVRSVDRSVRRVLKHLIYDARPKSS